MCYHDVDEGWELVMYKSGSQLYCLEDLGDSAVGFSCGWETLVRQVPPLCDRVETIIATLKSALGADYWTERKLVFE